MPALQKRHATNAGEVTVSNDTSYRCVRFLNPLTSYEATPISPRATPLSVFALICEPGALGLTFRGNMV